MAERAASQQEAQKHQGNMFKKKDRQRGFGAFKGVYLPNIVTTFGVIMYLRLGWVVGNIGLFWTLIFITIGSAIALLTGLSISSIVTNMKVKGGGAYFIISRSLGIEAGAAIGVPMFLAQAIGISFYIAGFAESIHAFFPEISLPLIGMLCLVILTVIVYLSTDLTLDIQIFILMIIALSLISFFLGDAPAAGFESSHTYLLAKAPFWGVFAVFFPAVTGFIAGISMSGDLKNPSKSLPFGTLSVIATSFAVYLAISWFLSSIAPKEVLLSNPMVMRDIASVGELVLLGIWAATISSALCAILGAARTLQALGRDRVLPCIFGKGYGPLDSPRIATAVSSLVALLGILIGDINAIAPVLTMFFLTSYGVINLIAGLEGLIGNPSWRPTFRTPWLLSFLGAALCLAAMIMINPGATIIAVFIVSFIFYLMSKRRMNARWADIRHSILLFIARCSIYRLDESEPNARSWRPSILVLSGAPTQRLYLIQLADSFTHGKGFLVVVSIISQGAADEGRLESMRKSVKEFLRKRHIPALTEVVVADDIYTGAKGLVRTYGLGPLTPNTFLLGETEKRGNFIQFGNLIKFIYQARQNLVVVRQGQAHPKTKRARRQIIVWWGGKRENVGLMLTLGYMLQSSPEWRGARLTLKTIVKREEEGEKIRQYLQTFLTEGRLTAGFEVLVNDSREDIISTTVRQFSQQADLVFMGIRPPDPNESDQEYGGYYEGLIKSTEHFPPLALVLAAEKIRFSEIFR